MERHNENGLAVAKFLEGHPMIKKIYYIGLESHPQHTLAAKMMGVCRFLPWLGTIFADSGYSTLNAELLKR